MKESCKHDVVKPHFTDRAYFPLNKDITDCVHSAISAGKYSPHFTDRAYFPLNKDITNCVHSAISAGKYSQLDLVQLEKLVENWKAENSSKDVAEQVKIYFRKCSDTIQMEKEVKVPIIAARESFKGAGDE